MDRVALYRRVVCYELDMSALHAVRTPVTVQGSKNSLIWESNKNQTKQDIYLKYIYLKKYIE
jgi:hypothetical protein